MDISKLLGAHYTKTFARHGASSEGVDWGSSPEKHRLRLEKMLAVILEQPENCSPSLLDVGCGYGSLLQLIRAQGRSVRYTGIDLCDSMVRHASQNYEDAQWIAGDFLSMETRQNFDYVVCNGILTQKLDASADDMDKFFRRLVKTMFSKCRIGVAFNIMTTHVNFMVPHLYYKDPIEIIQWCISELTTSIKLDHAYPLFEYTVYLYKTEVLTDYSLNLQP